MDQISADLKPLKRILTDEDFFYQIPNYQRPYAWDKENISELVDDLTKAFSDSQESEYFCGSLVTVYNENDRRHDVIDGQQRLTTFTILACVVRDIYGQSLESRTKSYISKSIHDEHEQSKHKLRFHTGDNKHVDFVNEIINGIQFQDVKNIERSFQSRYLQNAHYIRKFLAEKISEYNIAINDFILWLYEKVVLTVIMTQSLDNAIRIFNVLNDRGMPLTAMDILKSTLMQGLPAEKDRIAFQHRWEQINNRFLPDDSFSFEDMLNTYLYFKLTSNPTRRLDQELLDIFKKEKTDPLAAIYEVDNFCSAYLNMLNDQDKNIYLLRYLQHRIYWHSILATAFFVKYENVAGLKSVLAAYYYQSWISGATVARIKQTSFNVLKSVKEKKPLDIIKQQCKGNLDTYGTTNGFLDELASSYIYSRNWARPILLLLEYFSHDDSVVNFIPLTPQLQVEHILPQTSDNESADWQLLFSKEERDTLTNSLGNLTLLSQRKNVQASNFSFADKKIDYGKTDGLTTSFNITKQLLEIPQWTPVELKKRHQKLEEAIRKYLDIFHD